MNATHVERTAEQEPQEREPQEVQRSRRNWSARFDDATGTAHLEVRLERKKTGWKSYVKHTVGNGKDHVVQRGASERHADERAARAAFERACAAAVAAKWQRRASRAFRSAPDAFTLASLPKPTAASAKRST